MIEDQDEDIRVIAQPWTNRLIDLVELVEGELVQLHQIRLPIGQTNVGKGLVRDVYSTLSYITPVTCNPHYPCCYQQN